MKKGLSKVLWVVGGAGALFLYKLLDKDMARAIDTQHWGTMIAWVVCGVLVLGCFGLAAKLGKG